MKRERPPDYRNLKEFDAQREEIMKWCVKYFKKTKTERPQFNTYQFKHMVEKSLGFYVPEILFIHAFEDAGFELGRYGMPKASFLKYDYNKDFPNNYHFADWRIVKNKWNTKEKT